MEAGFLWGWSLGDRASSLRNTRRTIRCVSQHHPSRRDVLITGIGVFAGLYTGSMSVQALVKGSAPPQDYGKRGPQERATNMEEARRLGESREAEMFGESSDFQVGASGDRYRDVQIGSGKSVGEAGEVDIRYRVLKAGKRSADGLTGEGSPVFSYGYGEDDDKEGSKLKIRVGDAEVVPALSGGIVGMKEGGIRRIRVLPERGWRKSVGCEKSIDVGTVVGLPGASLNETESCMDLSRLPAPSTYQGVRKLSRRFDGTLILEVEAVQVF
mmetsp:Transcript_30310/g.116245  ORF Transcript_30310/g.116245 Transcript_30310/m.116245 type:complete len:270 (-) Transcript_30310:2532-3341(-)